MNLLAFFSPTRWLMLIAAVAALTLGYYGWRGHQRSIGAAPYITAIAVQKAEATRLLAAETEKVEATQKQLELALLTQEKTDALNQQKSDGMADRLRRLAAAADGRLRDPAGCGRSSSSPSGQAAATATDRADNDPQASGLLSTDLSRLLLDQAKTADAVNLAYASCRADAFAVRVTP
ncbi:MAG: hypothetical protein JJD98_00270 [Polaromonas sp.]|nr:hypothetical protein [Polaromonas sp.]